MWEILGDDGKEYKGIGFCEVNKPLVLETKLDRPGFVHVICTAVDEKGTPISDFDVLDASEGADIEKLQYCDTVHDDFDKY